MGRKTVTYPNCQNTFIKKDNHTCAMVIDTPRVSFNAWDDTVEAECEDPSCCRLFENWRCLYILEVRLQVGSQDGTRGQP